MKNPEDSSKPVTPRYEDYTGLHESPSSWWREAFSKLRGRDLAIVGIIAITWSTLQLGPMLSAYLFAGGSNILLFALGWRR